MEKKSNVKIGTAKAVADAKVVKAIAYGKAETPKSDMQNVYDKVVERFDAEDIAVNTELPQRVEIGDDFVDDCSAMIPTRTGTPPEYAPFNFAARVTCVATKGSETGLRLDILKNTVRAALMKEPIDFGDYRISIVITDEQDSVVVGFRKSVLTFIMKAEIKKNKRW